MISISHVTKQYRKLIALQDVSLEFRAGQSIALIGPNGSGKSTLMKSILGLVHPEKGTIHVMQEAVSRSGHYRTVIGYMPQIIHFPEHMQVKQLFAMMRDIRNNPDQTDEDLYRAFHISDMSAKHLGALSGGMKQKVNAALAFLFDPKIIILDEPTAGLDPLSAEILKEKIRTEKEKGKLILISSHIMADLEEITTDVLYLIDGHVEFFQDLETLKRETGTTNLGKAIAQVMANKNVLHEAH